MLTRQRLLLLALTGLVAIGLCPARGEDQPQQAPITMKPRWTAEVRTDGKPARLYIDEANQIILLGSERSTLMSFNLNTGYDRQFEFSWFGMTRGNSFIPMEGGRVAKCTLDETEVQTWEEKSGKPSEKYTVPDSAGDGKGTHRYVQISPDGRYLVVARIASLPDKPVPFQVFDTKSRKSLVTEEWVEGSIHFAANPARVLVAERTGRFRWFKLPEGEVEEEWGYAAPGPGQTHVVTSVSADGRVIGYNGPAEPGTNPGPYLVHGKSGEVRRLGAKYVARSPVILSGDGRFAAVLLSMKDHEAIIDISTVENGVSVAQALIPINGTSPTFTLSTHGYHLLVHDPKNENLFHFRVPISGRQ